MLLVNGESDYTHLPGSSYDRAFDVMVGAPQFRNGSWAACENHKLAALVHVSSGARELTDAPKIDLTCRSLLDSMSPGGRGD